MNGSAVDSTGKDGANARQPLNESSQPKVPGHCDEIASVRVEPAHQRKRIVLRSRLVAKVPHHLQRDHARDPFAARPAFPGMNRVQNQGGSSKVKATHRSVTWRLTRNNRANSSKVVTPLALSSAPGVPAAVS